MRSIFIGARDLNEDRKDGNYDCPAKKQGKANVHDGTFLVGFVEVKSAFIIGFN